MKGYPESVSRLIDAFARLPGIGRRSAERLAFHVLRESSQEAMSLAQAITDAKTRIVHCPTCWNICDDLHCEICSDPRREASIVLVVEQPKDVLAIEKTGSFRGIYHVLLGRLDPLAGVGPEGIVLEPLLARIEEKAGHGAGKVRLHAGATPRSRWRLAPALRRPLRARLGLGLL